MWWWAEVSAVDQRHKPRLGAAASCSLAVADVQLAEPAQLPAHVVQVEHADLVNPQADVGLQPRGRVVPRGRDELAAVPGAANRPVRRRLRARPGGDSRGEGSPHDCLPGLDHRKSRAARARQPVPERRRRVWREMRLRSVGAQVVTVGDLGLTVSFDTGEEMRTEVSAKFRPAGIRAELAGVGFRTLKFWTDPTATSGSPSPSWPGRKMAVSGGCSRASATRAERGSAGSAPRPVCGILAQSPSVAMSGLGLSRRSGSWQLLLTILSLAGLRVPGIAVIRGWPPCRPPPAGRS
jgi:hypothetical protein